MGQFQGILVLRFKRKKASLYYIESFRESVEERMETFRYGGLIMVEEELIASWMSFRGGS